MISLQESEERRSGKRAFVVLGMHRSGTSASTRALSALGVEMGSDLLEAAPSENPKGFFEDEPLLELSDRVLEALDMAWDCPRLIPSAAWESAALAPLELEAAESIRQRFGGIADWGFKNPRTARLLPFWQRVFARCDREAVYLIVLRNPLSVSKSLQVRNGMAPRRAHLLWLLHMVESVVHTRGRARICLDYDALVDDPETQLRRLAEGLGLPSAIDASDAVRVFTEEFLSTDLRSTRFTASDLDLAPELSALAMSAYQWLARWSRDDADLSLQQLQRHFVDIQRRLKKIEPVLADLAETEAARRHAIERREAERALREEFAEGLQRSQAQSLEGERQLEAARQRLTQLEAETAAKEGQLEEGHRMSGLLEAQLENVHRDLVAANQRLEDTHTRLERARAREERFVAVEVESRRRAEEIESLRRERADVLRAHRDALEASGEALRRVEEEAETRANRLSARIGHLESERTAERGIVAELRAEAEARENALERLRDQRDAEADRSRAWLREQALLLATGVVEQIDALEASRQWRIARAVQRGVSRLRGRTWLDGMAQLQLEARTLRAETQSDHFEIRSLAAQSEQIKRTLRDFSGGEIFRLTRFVSMLRHALRPSSGPEASRPEGPFEFVRNRVGEMQFFFEHLSFAPSAPDAEIASGVPREVGSIVDVVIPVYKAREQTIRCIESVLESTGRTPREIVVIDDASQDAGLDRRLSAWADDGVITLLRNERNLGFPATANRAMALHPDRDVVLLNSDTLVHGDWLDRLRRSAHRDWRIATATPFSNNAEICSYPALCRADAMPSKAQLAEIDARAARTNRSLGVTIPTAVGFCMYIRREALRQVGDFDAERFGRGYGEENDFCLRARTLGYRHVLAADVYVAHEGGVSFSDAKAELIEQGLAELDQLYPGYLAEIQSFIDADPVRFLRQRLDRAELAPANRPAMLMVSHSKGGGTHRHVVEIAEHLESEGITVLLLQPTLPGFVRLSRAIATSAESKSAENLEYRLPRDFDLLVETLSEANVRHVHLQHLMGIDDCVIDLASALGCEYDATLHDYNAICPRVHVMDDRGRYCGLPDPQACNACIKRNGSEAGFEVDIETWREGQKAWLSGARKVFVPSVDAKNRLAPFLPAIDIVVRPHPEDHACSPSLAAPAKPGRTRRVAVIGAIGPHKGSEILHACARDAARRDLPLEFQLIGFSDRDQELLDTKKVTISGHYAEEELEHLLRKSRCHLTFIPSVWPETFCYTLSAAFRWQIYPVGFDLGAVADRIAEVGWGETLAIDSTASEINDRLLDLAIEPFPDSDRPERFVSRYSSFRRDYYDGLKSLPESPSSSVS